MHEYRLKQPKNWLDRLESVFFSVFGLGLILMERRIALGLTLFAFAAWSLWRDFYKRSREIVFSEEGICKISREGMQTLPLEDFCGVAVFTDTKRSRIINIYRIALVPKQPYDTPLTVYTVVQSFTRLPAFPRSPSITSAIGLPNAQACRISAISARRPCRSCMQNAVF